MASSATNKQPLLVDRPLHEWAAIGGIPALTTATNYNTPFGAGCVMLVDCTSGDGAVLDSLSVLISETGTTQSAVLAFLSDAETANGITPLNTACVCSVLIPSGNTLGQRVNTPLPPLTIPVPSLASPAATVSAYPSETDKKNTGLYVPAGKCLYVGVSAPLTAPNAATRVIVAAQGGYF